VTDKLESIWKENVMAKPRYDGGIFLEGPSKNHEKPQAV
jgi:hypothetical protein